MLVVDNYLVCVWVSDLLVELLPLQHQVTIPWLDDPALGGDGPGGVDVVPSDLNSFIN